MGKGNKTMDYTQLHRNSEVITMYHYSTECFLCISLILSNVVLVQLK